MIGLLLQVNPRQRPAVDVLLQLPVMLRHSHYDSTSNGDAFNGGIKDAGGKKMEMKNASLLATIKLPKDGAMNDVTSALPAARYEDAIAEETEADIMHAGGPIPIPMPQSNSNQPAHSNLALQAHSKQQRPAHSNLASRNNNGGGSGSTSNNHSSSNNGHSGSTPMPLNADNLAGLNYQAR